MKKLKYLLLLILLMPTAVFAAGSASISVNSSVENGSNITATLVLSNVAAWDVQFNGSGSTNGCSTHEADVTSSGNNTTKKITITCKATSEGSITFKASGDVTSSDGTNTGVSVSKTVKVTKQRNSNANLKSLSVSDASINFSSSTTDYRVVVDNSVTSVNVSASAQESTSSVSGTGNKSLNVYDNYISVTCKAENGSTKTYNINVVRRDENGNDHVLSNVNSLTNITIEGYTLIFDDSVKEYTILVKSQDLLNITATPTETTETVTVNNVEQMINGNNVITIEVSSESGKIQEYTINAVLLDEAAKCECPEPKCDYSDSRLIIIVLGTILGIMSIGIIVYIIIRIKKQDPEVKKAKKEAKASKKAEKKTAKKNKKKSKKAKEETE